MQLIIGAIIGDVIGSVFEWNNCRSKDFSLFQAKSTFTDDTVLTVATMEVLLDGEDYGMVYQKYARAYPNRGYGGRFRKWIDLPTPQPYNSLGNGSGMRVSPVGFAFDPSPKILDENSPKVLSKVLKEAQKSAEATHNHPEGIKGAQAIAAAIFLSRAGQSKDTIKEFIENTFGYPLNRTLDEIRPNYKFNETCPGSVPEAIIAFLESTDFEDAIRNAISIGGDSDTIACMTGGIAQAFYRTIPDQIVEECLKRLPLPMIKTIERFSQQVALNRR